MDNYIEFVCTNKSNTMCYIPINNTYLMFIDIKYFTVKKKIMYYKYYINLYYFFIIMYNVKTT